MRFDHLEIVSQVNHLHKRPFHSAGSAEAVPLCSRWPVKNKVAPEDEVGFEIAGLTCENRGCPLNA